MRRVQRIRRPVVRRPQHMPAPCWSCSATVCWVWWRRWQGLHWSMTNWSVCIVQKTFKDKLCYVTPSWLKHYTTLREEDPHKNNIYVKHVQIVIYLVAAVLLALWCVCQCMKGQLAECGGERLFQLDLGLIQILWTTPGAESADLEVNNNQTKRTQLRKS